MGGVFYLDNGALQIKVEKITFMIFWKFKYKLDAVLYVYFDWLDVCKLMSNIVFTYF
ncbi:hypothetical protein KAM348_07440 [Aeromonas caviae]|uniref:Uncharacterized protein n=1 Tax=Aeromonas caviae TaxID=648 RepID=A0AAI9KQ29_AERCA|nr:hypothetical protein KAM348_07440 [Aeromonas caviae]